jgi:hypothetical protein
MSERDTLDEQLHDSKRGVAILVACLVQEIEKYQPGFQEGYLARLGQAYEEVRHDADPLDRLELLNWTRELLTGFNPISGQGAPFLDGR